jgi:hypothetical protein
MVGLGQGQGQGLNHFGYLYFNEYIACKVTAMPTIIATAEPINNKSL